MKKVGIALITIAILVLMFLAIDYGFKSGWLHQRHPPMPVPNSNI